MKPRILPLLVALLVPACAALADGAPALPAKKILFFSKSSGYEHGVIKLPTTAFSPGGGNLVAGTAFAVLRELGAKNAIEFVFSKDGSLFTPQYLAQFDAYFFVTTGDLTTPGTDGNPPMTPAGKQALLDAVAGGKGFIGAHCATDTFHSQGGMKDRTPSRYMNDGDNADPYIKMIGGEFVIHGRQQKAHLIVADPKFPGISAVPLDNDATEEWYSLKNFADNLHVLLVQDTLGMSGIEYRRPNYPSTWARMYGKGRVFYTNMGHRDDIWNGPVFQSVLMGGINWAVGRVDADVTPNLADVTPQASVLPPEPPAKN